MDYRGEVFSLSRWVGVKTKALNTRLGDPNSLPGIEGVKAQISRKMTKQLENYIQEIKTQVEQKKEPLIHRKQALKKHHHEQRMALKAKQNKRWRKKSIERSKRLPKGLKAIWHRITGKYRKIQEQNELEADCYHRRDRGEKQTLIDRQLKQRQKLQVEIKEVQQLCQRQYLELKQDMAHYLEVGGMPPPQKTEIEDHQERTYGPEL